MFRNIPLDFRNAPLGSKNIPPECRNTPRNPRSITSDQRSVHRIWKPLRFAGGRVFELALRGNSLAAVANVTNAALRSRFDPHHPAAQRRQVLDRGKDAASDDVEPGQVGRHEVQMEFGVGFKEIR